MHEKSASQTDAMTQRRYRNEEQAGGAIRVPIPNGNNIPTGNNSDLNKYTRPQLSTPEAKMPERALRPENSEHKVTKRQTHSKSELEARKKLTKEQKELIRYLEREGDKGNTTYGDYPSELREIAETLGVDTKGMGAWSLTMAINDVLGSRM